MKKPTVAYLDFFTIFHLYLSLFINLLTGHFSKLVHFESYFSTYSGFDLSELRWVEGTCLQKKRFLQNYLVCN